MDLTNIVNNTAAWGWNVVDAATAYVAPAKTVIQDVRDAGVYVPPVKVSTVQSLVVKPKPNPASLPVASPALTSLSPAPAPASDGLVDEFLYGPNARMYQVGAGVVVVGLLWYLSRKR